MCRVSGWVQWAVVMAAVAKAAKAATAGVADSSAKDDSAGGAGLMTFSDKGCCPDLSVSQVRHQTLGRASMRVTFRARLHFSARNGAADPVERAVCPTRCAR